MRFRLAVSLFVCLTVASLASLPTAAQSDKDMEEVRSYILTMDTVSRMYTTMYEIKQAAEKDPNLQKTLSSAADDKAEQTLTGAVNKISAFPTLVAIMANHHFTPRQLIVAEFATIQAGFAAAAVKAGTSREQLISSGAVSAANLDFVQQHHSELEELAKKYPIAQ